MSRIIERATAHYAGLGTGRAEVPEWGEEGRPLVVHFHPFTLADKRRVFAGDRPLAERAVEVVILKALDGDGGKLFTLEDKQALMTRADAAVVERLAAAILHFGEAGDAAKN